MKRRTARLGARIWGACLALLAPAFATANPTATEAPALPVIDGEPALAVVNGEPISIDFFLRELASLHGTAHEASSTRPRQQPTELLERLINIRLVLQEARSIGLDELPAVRESLAAYEVDALKQMLYRQQSATVGAVDPAEIESEYREAVREAQVFSVLMRSEPEALALVERLRAGGDFKALAAELVADGKAESGDDAAFLRTADMLPAVRDAIDALQPGEIGTPVRIGRDWAVIQLLAIRYPDDAEVRERLAAQALQRKQSAALKEYADSLVARHTVLDRALFDALDYETPEPGMNALLADERILATLEGEEPIRVKELSAALKQEFFHGVERAIGEGKVNARKQVQLDRLLRNRAVLHEARRLGLDKSDDYLMQVAEFENGLLFQAFVERVVAPDVRLDEKELRAFAAAHAAEFSSPAMVRLEGLAFERREDAERALARLREGADFAWTRGAAEGQADPGRPGGLLAFPDTPVLVSALPADVSAALADARAGDYRLYAPVAGPFYVLRVRQWVDPVPQPYEAVRETVAQRAVTDRRAALLEEWFAKLRAASEIEVFATAESLDRLLRGAARGES